MYLGDIFFVLFFFSPLVLIVNEGFQLASVYQKVSQNAPISPCTVRKQDFKRDSALFNTVLFFFFFIDKQNIV